MLPSNGYLTMKGFGRWGRFGNQMFQFMFLTNYACKHNLTLQLPPWVGCELFGLATDPITVDLPPVEESPDCFLQAEPLPDGKLVNGDFRGYAQYHTSYYRENKDRIQEMFTPVAALRERLEPAAAKLHADGRVAIGLHIRRGDYGRGIFPIIPTSWYRKWLEEHWGRFWQPRLFIASETPALVAEFADYSPETAESLGVQLKAERLPHYNYLPRDTHVREPWQLDFYPDFYLLTQCDVIVAANSTFSFMAAMLSKGLVEFWRASLEIEGFEKLDPWDSLPLKHEDCANYPHLKGITCESNPYW